MARANDAVACERSQWQAGRQAGGHWRATHLSGGRRGRQASEASHQASFALSLLPWLVRPSQEAAHLQQLQALWGTGAAQAEYVRQGKHFLFPGHLVLVAALISGWTMRRAQESTGTLLEQTRSETHLSILWAAQRSPASPKRSRNGKRGRCGGYQTEQAASRSSMPH
jgi:hypothetical protein